MRAPIAGGTDAWVERRRSDFAQGATFAFTGSRSDSLADPARFTRSLRGTSVLSAEQPSSPPPGCARRGTPVAPVLLPRHARGTRTGWRGNNEGGNEEGQFEM